jgi:translation elongation factor EF-Ts
MSTGEVSAMQVTILRRRTGASMMDATRAIKKADGDILLAQGILKYQGCAIHVKGMTHEEWVMKSAREWCRQIREGRVA